MKITLLFSIAGLMLIGATVFADDVSIDSNGNVTTNVNSSGNLEVTGASAEKAVVGLSSGSGGTGVEGKNITYGNYGILGGFYSSYDVGVYGYSTGGYAGYFQGDAWVTGNLTVEGTFAGYTETDPVFSVWDRSSGISIAESQITDLDHFTTSDETDPQVGTLTSSKWCTTDGTQVICTSDTPVSGDGHSLDAADGSPTDAVYVDNAGNVGIGTPIPNYKLEVSGSSSTYIGYFINDNDTGSAAGLYVEGDALDAGSGDAFGGSFFGYGGGTSGEAYGILSYAYANGSSPAYGVYSNATMGSTNGREYAFYGEGDSYFSGNVGIGTPLPNYKLEVTGSHPSYIGLFNNDNDTGGDAAGISARGDAYDTGSGYGYGGEFFGIGGSTGGNAYGIVSYSFAYGSSPAFGVVSNATGGTTTGREYAFYGDGDGYFSGSVGVGTDTPDNSGIPGSLLHVAGSDTDRGVLNIGSSSAVTGGAVATTVYSSAGTRIAQVDVVTDSTFSDRGHMRFYTNPGAGVAERMRIDNSGNVGIGTAAPSSKLEVRGEIRSTDPAGYNRLWGEGRKYITLDTSWNVCPGNEGTEFAISNELATWFASPSACPANTWICSYDEVRFVTVQGVPAYTYIDCNGEIYGNLGRHFWTASPAADPMDGLTKKIDQEELFVAVKKCNMRKVMCCRETP
jgi:hypothetical protein